MSNIHPIFREALRGIAPPPLSEADRALAQQFAGSEPFEAATEPAPLRKFVVRRIRGGCVEKQFEAFAPDSMTCAAQHADLADGAKIEVLSYAAWLELQDMLAEDRSYFAERSARPDYRSERGELDARARLRESCVAEVRGVR